MAQLGSTVVAGSLTVTDDVNLVKPLPISSGGTGQSTGVNACNVLLNSLTTGSSDPVDDDYYIAQYVGGGTTTTTYHRRPVSKLWNYIKSKLGISTGTTSYLRNDGTWATPDDHITTASTTGTGNAVTAISADANGALTVTKGNTFLTSHQDIKQDGITGATVNRFGTCSTAAATAAKTVSITTGTFTLEAGARVSVKFSNANTAGTPTLNVASKGAKNIFFKGAQIKTDSSKKLLTGVCDFIYDGTQWHLVGTNYGNESAADSGTDLSLVTTGEKYIWGNKQASITGAATTITSSNLTASRALISNSNGKVAISDVTSTELGYLDGVTSAIQTQLNAKAGTAVATTSANGLMSSSDKTKLDYLSLWEII